MAAPVFATNDQPSADQANDWFVNVNFKYKTATESVTSSTTLQADDHLTVPVEANAIYTVDVMLIADGASAGGLKVQWTAPASATFDWTVSAMDNGASAYTSDQAAAFSLASIPSFGLAAGSLRSPVQILGLLVTSGTAGNFALTWAQSTLSGTATRILQNSFVSLRRVS
jgi:hypothetical protein